MAAYIIVQRTAVLDPDGMAEYVREGRAVIAQYGGRVVAAAPAEVAEGDWTPERLVIVEFPSMAQLKAFYDGPEYAPLKALRQRSARTNLVFVEGV